MAIDVKKQLTPASIDMAIEFNVQDTVTSLIGCGLAPSAAYQTIRRAVDKLQKAAEQEADYE